MPHSARSSTTSPPVRLDWRPSRLLIALLVALTCAAASVPWLSSLPSGTRIAASCLALLHGALVARREAGRRPFEFVWPAGDVLARCVYGETAAALEVEALRIQAGLAILRIRDADGRRRSLAWWPDTLDATGRRALRLAWSGAGASGAAHGRAGRARPDQPAIRQTR